MDSENISTPRIEELKGKIQDLKNEVHQLGTQYQETHDDAVYSEYVAKRANLQYEEYRLKSEETYERDYRESAFKIIEVEFPKVSPEGERPGFKLR